MGPRGARRARSALGVLGMSLNEAQFFGRIEDSVWAAAGYNGVGVAMGTASGWLLADLIVVTHAVYVSFVESASTGCR